MTTAQTVCLLCFVLLLGSAHANKTLTTKANEIGKSTEMTSETSTDKMIFETSTNEMTFETSTNKKLNDISKQGSSALNCICTPTPTETSTKDDLKHYIISLPKETAILVLVVLVVACITLLLITLLCTCHVCHMRTVISRLQPYHSVDLYSVKKRSESPCKDDGKEKDQPTETCLMLAEVTVQEEEKKEEKKEEKEEESVPIYTEPPAEKPNGDVTQEENAYDIVSDEPAVGTTEVSDTGV